MLKNILKKKISCICKCNYIVFLILVNILLQVSSFVLVKVAAINTYSYIDLFFSIYYLAAISLILIRSVVWQLVLKEKDISQVYPLNSFVPVLILLSGVLLFNENVTANNIIGVLILIFGIFFIVDK